MRKVLLALVSVVAVAAPLPATAAPAVSDPIAATRLVEDVNSHRLETAMPALARSDALDALAARKVRAMASVRRIYHDERWLRRNATRIVPSWTFVGENVGLSWTEVRPAQEAASRLARSFVASESHRLVMEDTRWNATGAAVFVTRNGTIYAAHYFALV